MIRLRNTQSGVVVSVADEKAPRLGDAWEPVVVAKATRPRKVKADDAANKRRRSGNTPRSDADK